MESNGITYAPTLNGIVVESTGVTRFFGTSLSDIATYRKLAGPSAKIGRVKAAILIGIGFGVAILAQTQERHVPRFEDYPADPIYTARPAEPILRRREERRFRTVIGRGVNEGLGVEDGITWKELAHPGPNFAGHYAIVKWGCGSPCVMAAFVNLTDGRVLPPPFHHGPGHSYFQVPWAFPKAPLQYRLNSRLLIANICEADKVSRVDGQASYSALRCGTHYFVMGESGLKLIYRELDPWQSKHSGCSR